MRNVAESGGSGNGENFFGGRGHLPCVARASCPWAMCSSHSAAAQTGIAQERDGHNCLSLARLLDRPRTVDVRRVLRTTGRVPVPHTKDGHACKIASSCPVEEL